MGLHLSTYTHADTRAYKQRCTVGSPSAWAQVRRGLRTAANTPSPTVATICSTIAQVRRANTRSSRRVVVGRFACATVSAPTSACTVGSTAMAPAARHHRVLLLLRLHVRVAVRRRLHSVGVVGRLVVGLWVRRRIPVGRRDTPMSVTWRAMRGVVDCCEVSSRTRRTSTASAAVSAAVAVAAWAGSSTTAAGRVRRRRKRSNHPRGRRRSFDR